MHVASVLGYEELLALLLAHGARIAVGDEEGRTCLHLACLGGHRDALGLLLDHGGDEVIDVQVCYQRN